MCRKTTNINESGNFRSTSNDSANFQETNAKYGTHFGSRQNCESERKKYSASQAVELQMIERESNMLITMCGYICMPFLDVYVILCRAYFRINATRESE